MSLSRAEVRADLELWSRAGLLSEPAENFDPTEPRIKAKIAEYQRMRSGPEFAQAVDRYDDAPSAQRRVAVSQLATNPALVFAN